MYKSKRPKKITVEYEDKVEKYIRSGVVISLEPVLVKGLKGKDRYSNYENG